MSRFSPILIGFDTEKNFEVKKDMKIAQLLIQSILAPDIIEVDTLVGGERGEGMHGSTGDF